jgi:hypothetical protein
MSFQDTIFSQENTKDNNQEATPRLVHQLLLDQTDLTTDEIDQEIKAKRDEYTILSTDLAAYYLVANDHNIDPNQELGADVQRELKIEDIHPGIQDLTL